MEPMKLRLLSMQGSRRPARMAQVDYEALRAFAEAPVHVAELALKDFVAPDQLDGAPARVFENLLKEHSSVVHYRPVRARVSSPYALARDGR